MKAFLNFAFLFFLFVIISCSYHEKANLNIWIGEYNYEEQPVKSNANYSMVMDWTVSISKNNDTYQGVLEINGQQTYLKSQLDIKGNSNKVALIYNNLIDGSNENFKKGDTLFTLLRKDNKLYTEWIVVEPRLLESPNRECICFTKK